MFLERGGKTWSVTGLGATLAAHHCLMVRHSAPLCLTKLLLSETFSPRKSLQCFSLFLLLCESSISVQINISATAASTASLISSSYAHSCCPVESPKAWTALLPDLS